EVVVDERTLLGLPAQLLLLPPSGDQLVGGLLRLPGAEAEGRLAPGGLGVPAGAGLALATTVRVVLRVHGRAADGGALAQPAVPAGLAAGLVLVLQVADLAHGRAAVDVDAAQLARGHPDGGAVAL